MREFKYLVTLALCLLPAAVFASGGEGGGLNAILSMAPGSMLWTLLTFIILLLILWKFAWGPIVKGLQAREDAIRNDIEQAKQDREEASKLLSEYEDKLKSASQEINERLSRAEQDANTRIEQARQEAREEGDKLIARAKSEIEAEKAKVESDLRSRIAELATDVASKAIAESFTREDQQRIIQQRLETLEKKS